MKFTKTPLEGAYVVELERKNDQRGFFARTWCVDEFSKHGLKTNLAQQNMSLTMKRGTLRGMHFQKAPHAETKVVRCTKGAIYDVIIDLRPDSPTHRQWFGIELTSENYNMVYVPEGFAHGFITLEDNSEVSYLVTSFYTPDAESGVRYDDPAFGIKWPIPFTLVSDRDASFTDYREKA